MRVRNISIFCQRLLYHDHIIADGEMWDDLGRPEAPVTSLTSHAFLSRGNCGRWQDSVRLGRRSRLCLLTMWMTSQMSLCVQQWQEMKTWHDRQGSLNLKGQKLYHKVGTNTTQLVMHSNAMYCLPRWIYSDVGMLILTRHHEICCPKGQVCRWRTCRHWSGPSSVAESELCRLCERVSSLESMCRGPCELLGDNSTYLYLLFSPAASLGSEWLGSIPEVWNMKCIFLYLELVVGTSC